MTRIVYRKSVAKRGITMKKRTTCGFITLLVLFLPFLSLASQTKGINVVVKDTSGRNVGLYKGSHALLIGISNYTAGWPKLERVPYEIEQVEAALKKQGFHVVKVMDPTSEALNSAFEDFIYKYGFDENNRLLFFFSGHGHTRMRGKKGYLVPADAPDPRYDEKGFARKAIGMGQILTWSREIEAKHALFLFDSCFSGTVFKAKALPEVPPHISDVTSRPVRQFISAGSAGEEVPASSVFTPSFIRAVRGEGDLDKDGYVTGTELGMFLHKKVLSYDTGQHPQYGKIKDPDLDEGDFVFALKTPSRPPPQYDRLQEERERLEQERRELERLKMEIERKRIEDKRKRLEDEKKRLEVTHLPQERQHPPRLQTLGEIGRDGALIAFADGVVRDTTTRLEWIVGPDNDTTWAEAKSWVEKVKSLNISGGGWRMPTARELESLYQRGKGKRNMTPFLKTSGWWVWAGQTEGMFSAWGFGFNEGAKDWNGRFDSDNCRAFAVRSQRDG